VISLDGFNSIHKQLVLILFVFQQDFDLELIALLSDKNFSSVKVPFLQVVQSNMRYAGNNSSVVFGTGCLGLHQVLGSTNIWCWIGRFIWHPIPT
jgi:hypothetical protein